MIVRNQAEISINNHRVDHRIKYFALDLLTSAIMCKTVQRSKNSIATKGFCIIFVHILI